MKACTASLLAAAAACVLNSFNAQHVLASSFFAGDDLRNSAAAYRGMPCHNGDFCSGHHYDTKPTINAHSQVEASGLSVSNLCGSCGEESCFEYDIDYCGSDANKLERGSVPYPAACQHICAQTADCKHWTYIPETSSCCLKSAVAVGGLTRRKSAISGPRVCPPAYTCYEQDIDYYGGDVKKIEGHLVISAEECQRICFTNPQCHFWTWVSSERNCYLKNEHARRGRVRAPGSISGPRDCTAVSAPSRQNRYEDIVDEAKCHEHNIVYSEAKHDVGRAVMGSTECQVLCQQHPSCRVFSYLRAEKKCMLGSTKGEEHLEKYAISGPKFCSGSYCTVEDVAYNGRIITDSHTPSFAMCLEMCQQDTNCSAATFNRNSGRCLLVQRAAYAPGFVSGPHTCIIRDQYSGEIVDTSALTVTYALGDMLCYESGTAYNSSPLWVSHVGSAELCQRRCRGDPRCNFFTYYLFGKICLAHESEGQKMPHETAVSGQSACPFSTSACFYDNVEVFGKDVGRCSTEDAVACQEVCRQNMLCSFFAYHKVSKTCFQRQHRGRASGATSAPAFCGAPIGRIALESQAHLENRNHGQQGSPHKPQPGLSEQGLERNTGGLDRRQLEKPQQDNPPPGVPGQRRVVGRRKQAKKLRRSPAEDVARKVPPKPAPRKRNDAERKNVVPPKDAMGSRRDSPPDVIPDPETGLADVVAKKVPPKPAPRKRNDAERRNVVPLKEAINGRRDSPSDVIPDPDTGLADDVAEKVPPNPAPRKWNNAERGNVVPLKDAMENRRDSRPDVFAFPDPDTGLAEHGAKKVPTKPVRRKWNNAEKGNVVPLKDAMENRRDSSPNVFVFPDLDTGLAEDGAKKVPTKPVRRKWNNAERGNVVPLKDAMENRRDSSPNVFVFPDLDTGLAEDGAKKVPTKPVRRKWNNAERGNVVPLKDAMENRRDSRPDFFVFPDLDTGLAEDGAERVPTKPVRGKWDNAERGNVVPLKDAMENRRDSSPNVFVFPDLDTGLAEDGAKKVPTKPVRRKWNNAERGNVVPLKDAMENRRDSRPDFFVFPDLDTGLAEDGAERVPTKPVRGKWDNAERGNVVPLKDAMKNRRDSSPNVFVFPDLDTGLAEDGAKKVPTKPVRRKWNNAERGNVVPLKDAMENRRDSSPNVFVFPDLDTGLAEDGAKKVPTKPVRRKWNNAERGNVVPLKDAMENRRDSRPDFFVFPDLDTGLAEDGAERVPTKPVRGKWDNAERGNVVPLKDAMENRRDSRPDVFVFPDLDTGLAEDGAERVPTKPVRGKWDNAERGNVVPLKDAMENRRDSSPNVFVFPDLDTGLAEDGAKKVPTKPVRRKWNNAERGNVVPLKDAMENRRDSRPDFFVFPDLDTGLAEDGAERVPTKPVRGKWDNAERGNVVPLKDAMKNRRDSRPDFFVFPDLDTGLAEDGAERVPTKPVRGKWDNAERGNVVPLKDAMENRRDSSPNVFVFPDLDTGLAEDGAKKVPTKPVRRKWNNAERGNVVPLKDAMENRRDSSPNVFVFPDLDTGLAEDGAKKVPTKPVRRKWNNAERGNVVPLKDAMENRRDSPSDVFVFPDSDTGLAEVGENKGTAERNRTTSQEAQLGDVAPPGDVPLKGGHFPPAVLAKPDTGLSAEDSEEAPAGRARRGSNKAQEQDVSSEHLEESRRPSTTTGATQEPDTLLAAEDEEKAPEKSWTIKAEKGQVGDDVPPEVPANSRFESPADFSNSSDAAPAENNVENLPGKDKSIVSGRSEEGDVVPPEAPMKSGGDSPSEILQKPDTGLTAEDAQKTREQPPRPKQSEKAQQGDVSSGLSKKNHRSSSAGGIQKPDAVLAAEDKEKAPEKSWTIKAEKDQVGDDVPPEAPANSRFESPADFSNSPDTALAENNVENPPGKDKSIVSGKSEEGDVVPPEASMKSGGDSPSEILQKPDTGLTAEDAQKTREQPPRPNQSEKAQQGDVSSGLSKENRRSSSAGGIQKPDTVLPKDGAKKVPPKPAPKTWKNAQKVAVVPPKDAMETRLYSPTDVFHPPDTNGAEHHTEKGPGKDSGTKTEEEQEGDVASVKVPVRPRRHSSSVVFRKPDTGFAANQVRNVPLKRRRSKSETQLADTRRNGGRFITDNFQHRGARSNVTDLVRIFEELGSQVESAERKREASSHNPRI